MAAAREAPGEDSIRVVCRFRPINDAEKSDGEIVVKFPPGTDDQCVNLDGQVYTFDKVFKPDVSQKGVYDEVAKSIVKDVLMGYNGTIFSYGQTSSGKTHTMEGVMGDPHLQGIIPRIVNDIFTHINALKENVEFHIKVSHFEVYKDTIRDLLDVSKVNLSVHEDKNCIPYVKNVTERFVTSPEEVFEVIGEGKANRHIAVTNMHGHSYGSHTIFLVNVKQENLENQKKLSGKLYLVDLAGTERVQKRRGSEAKFISKSLSALGDVVSALASNQSHIPYRNSKLTRILQESLGGNARTTILICCSPAYFNKSETKTTLDFGQRAKSIKKAVTVNEEFTVEEWKRRFEKEREKAQRYKTKLKKAEAELQRKIHSNFLLNRWRSGESVRQEEQVHLLDAMVLPTTSVAPAAPVLPPVLAAPAVRDVWESERERLYQQLNDKDEEINQQSQLVEKLKKQMLEQEELNGATLRVGASLQQEMKAEKETAEEKVRGLSRILEELAVNYGQKSQEVEAKNRDNETVTEELSQRQSQLNSTLLELAQVKDTAAHQCRKLNDLLTSLFKDLNEMGVAFGADLKSSLQPFDSNSSKSEEEFTMARIYVSKMKSEVKSLVQRCQTLESSQSESSKKMDESERKLVDLRLLITQHEAKMKALQENMKDVENKKRNLEEAVDSLNEECAKLKVAEQLQALLIKAALEQQLDQQREAHQKQVAKLRDEITDKQTVIEDLRDSKRELSQLTLIHEQLVRDHERLKQEEAVKNELLDANERREQVRSDMKGLEETVAKELQTLHNLRKLFVQDLQSRVQKSLKGEEPED
uniref:Kinesin motor domain-containing protein n=1 Tax=Daphnia galeata TaxID=27404 RepID=A0A8J2RS84_9CRUS|nr:unnamed protein product [Daphnia galeata]